MCSDNKTPEHAPTPEEVVNTYNVLVDTATRRGEDETEDRAQAGASEPRVENQKAVAMGAAAVGFGTGYLLAGPLIGLAGAAGGYMAANSQGTVGDKARAVGGAAVKGYKKGADLFQEHQVGAKAKAAWNRAVQKTLEINEKYKISEKTQQACAATGREVVKIDEKYDLTGKAKRGLAKGLEVLSNKGGSVAACTKGQAPPENVGSDGVVIPLAQPVPAMNAAKEDTRFSI